MTCTFTNEGLSSYLGKLIVGQLGRHTRHVLLVARERESLLPHGRARRAVLVPQLDRAVSRAGDDAAASAGRRRVWDRAKAAHVLRMAGEHGGEVEAHVEVVCEGSAAFAELHLRVHEEQQQHAKSAA